ncbi:MAG: hypothetical protein CXR30_13540 [Geobacter sp.]|nr:MAG: hypothetical protein CXR30_13540 [Geobacter sp.]
MKNYYGQFIAVLVFLLLSATIALGASVTITPASGKEFTVMGNNMDGVSGIDLLINYDSSALSSPTVSPGNFSSGALFAANPNFTTNTIKIGIINGNGLSGSGPLATITFAKGSGSLSIASENLIDGIGAAVAVNESSSTPGIPFSQPETASTSQTSSTATTETTPSTNLSTSLGTVSMPSGDEPQHPKQAEPAPTEPAPPSADNAAATETEPPPEEQPVIHSPKVPVKQEEAKFTTYTSVLDRFRSYTGEKSPAILMSLFKKDVAPSIHQEPLVALSDGIMKIKVHVALSSSDDKSPNFALNGANLVSLKRGEAQGSWLIEALPHANTLKAGLTILDGSEVTEFPFTVAPPIKDVATNEAGFAAFLQKPADLNKDGKFDYIDEFIYTANYVAQIEITEHVDKKKKTK